MSVDLVLATKDRTEPVARFLEALGRQTHRDVRLIVVDQNEDDRLSDALERVDPTIWTERVASTPGLSRGRNEGIRRVRSEIVAFPDDDCLYPPDLLSRVVSLLAAHPEWDGVTCRSRDPGGRPSRTRWATRAGRLTEGNVWRRAIGPTIFLRRRVVEAVGLFDVRVGAGAGTEIGCGEETDYLIRALREGFHLRYDPGLVVLHADGVDLLKDTARAIGYGRGWGFLLRKHRYPAWFALYVCARPLLGAVLAGLSGRRALARYRWLTFAGRASGLARYRALAGADPR